MAAMMPSFVELMPFKNSCSGGQGNADGHSNVPLSTPVRNPTLNSRTRFSGGYPTVQVGAEESVVDIVGVLPAAVRLGGCEARENVQHRLHDGLVRPVGET